jgi:hypothetical protein
VCVCVFVVLRIKLKVLNHRAPLNKVLRPEEVCARMGCARCEPVDGYNWGYIQHGGLLGGIECDFPCKHEKEH